MAAIRFASQLNGHAQQTVLTGVLTADQSVEPAAPALYRVNNETAADYFHTHNGVAAADEGITSCGGHCLK
jgi:hypothetical protein